MYSHVKDEAGISRGLSEQTVSEDANFGHCICCLNMELILSDGPTALCPTVLMYTEDLAFNGIANWISS